MSVDYKPCRHDSPNGETCIKPRGHKRPEHLGKSGNMWIKDTGKMVPYHRHELSEYQTEGERYAEKIWGW